VPNEHPYKRCWEYNNIRVIDCNQCSFKHVYPLPTEKDLKFLYEEQFGGKVRRGFSERKKTDEEYWNLAFERRLYTYNHNLNSRSSMAPKILDVGCGTGNLLIYFREHGFRIQGIEPSQIFAEELEYSKIPNIPKLFNEITAAEWENLGKFDVINMSMFLEHVLDPLKIINKVKSLLNPGGILTIESPNDFNSLQMSIIETQNLPMWWITALHINYFDFESLESLVKRAGLEPVVRNAQFPMEIFLHFGEQYVGSSDVGRSVHLKRVAFEKNLHKSNQGRLLDELYKNIAKLGIGRTAIIHSKKVN
jgi:2-polyprenyl-3-methyl-5-hydroxy-6-metoxy-1,4-benzoquinol methylase